MCIANIMLPNDQGSYSITAQILHEIDHELLKSQLQMQLDKIQFRRSSLGIHKLINIKNSPLQLKHWRRSNIELALAPTSLTIFCH